MYSKLHVTKLFSICCQAVANLLPNFGQAVAICFKAVANLLLSYSQAVANVLASCQLR